MLTCNIFLLAVHYAVEPCISAYLLTWPIDVFRRGRSESSSRSRSSSPDVAQKSSTRYERQGQQEEQCRCSSGFFAGVPLVLCISCAHGLRFQPPCRGIPTHSFSFPMPIFALPTDSFSFAHALSSAVRKRPSRRHRWARRGPAGTQRVAPRRCPCWRC